MKLNNSIVVMVADRERKKKKKIRSGEQWTHLPDFMDCVVRVGVGSNLFIVASIYFSSTQRH